MKTEEMKSVLEHAKQFCETATWKDGLIYIDTKRANGKRWTGYIGLLKGATLVRQQNWIESQIKKAQA